MDARTVKYWCACALFLGCAATVQAGEMMEHLREAIQNGRSSGVLGGQIAANIMKRTGSPEQPLVQVDVIGHFESPDCKRLRVIVAQDGVPTKEGQKAAVRLPGFELNMCLDGQPPAETLNAETQEKYRATLKRQIEEQRGREY